MPLLYSLLGMSLLSRTNHSLSSPPVKQLNINRHQIVNRSLIPDWSSRSNHQYQRPSNFSHRLRFDTLFRQAGQNSSGCSTQRHQDH